MVKLDTNQMGNTCGEAAVTGQDPTESGCGQIVHRFVNNFHIHQSGEQTVCGNCGGDKACLRCSKAGKKQCEICGIWISSNPYNVAYHHRVHSRQRPFKCDQCPSSFTQHYDLRRHMLIHTREMPYLCEVCGIQFRRRSHLTNHQASIHSHKRPFECNSCGKAFKRRDDLMRHKREVHNCGYMCPECKENFRTRNEFSEHHAAVHARDAGLIKQPAEIDSKMDDSSENYFLTQG